MTTDEYEQSLKVLMDKTIYCEANRQIYKRLTELCGIGKTYEVVLEKGNLFFGMMVDNLLNELLMELSRIYDEGSFGLLKVINIIYGNKELSTEYCNKLGLSKKVINQLVIDVKQIYDGVKECREKLFTIRDKHLAHTDKDFVFDYGALYKDFTWRNVEVLIEAAAEIINRLTDLLNGTQINYNWIDDGNVNIVIHAMYKGLNS